MQKHERKIRTSRATDSGKPRSNPTDGPDPRPRELEYRSGGIFRRRLFWPASGGYPLSTAEQYPLPCILASRDPRGDDKRTFQKTIPDRSRVQRYLETIHDDRRSRKSSQAAPAVTACASPRNAPSLRGGAGVFRNRSRRRRMFQPGCGAARRSNLHTERNFLS